MYNPKEVFKKEPAVLAGALQTVVNAVVGFGLVSASAEQLAGVNVAVLAVLTLFYVRPSVTPNAKL